MKGRGVERRTARFSFFFETKGTRHEDLPSVFLKLVRLGKVPKDGARFAGFLARAASDKSGADYGKKSFSIADAENYVAEAEEFVAMAKSALKRLV